MVIFGPNDAFQNLSPHFVTKNFTKEFCFKMNMSFITIINNQNWRCQYNKETTKFAMHAILLFQDYVVDPDELQNQQAVFSISSNIFTTEPLRTQLRGVQNKDPFLLDTSTGTLFTNIYFQPDMQGYFSFQVKVNDSVPGHSDIANVSVSAIKSTTVCFLRIPIL